MTGPFEVGYSLTSQLDLKRLYAFLIERAVSEADEYGNVDFDRADQVITSIEYEIGTRLRLSPFLYPKVGDDPLVRKLTIPVGHTGYRAIFAVVPETLSVNVLRIEHQRERGLRRK